MNLLYGVLGHLEVTGQPGVSVTAPMQRSLLAFLVSNVNVPLRRDMIVEALWPDADPRKASQTLRFHVSKLRDALDPERHGAEHSPVVTQGDGYMLAADRQAVDALRFEDMVDLARDDLAGAPLSAHGLLTRALAVWRGPAYSDFRYESWAQHEIGRLTELRLNAVEMHHEAALSLGAGPQLVPDLEALVREHPGREVMRRQLMLALYRSGRQTDALREYDRFEKWLRETVGLIPEPQMITLRDKILNHHPSLVEAADPAAKLEVVTARGYELREELGRGSFGPVFEAYQRDSGECRAVRVVETDIANRTEFLRAFEAEAGRVARLRSAAVAPLLDYWREPGGTFLAYPYYPATLEARWSEVAGNPDRIADVLSSVGMALDAAGRIGLAHGAVHERNIFVDGDGRTYLGDFGFRQMRNGGRTFDGDGAPTPQTDVFGVAALATRLLTGDRTAAPAIITSEMNGEFGGAGEVLRAGLADDPDERPADSAVLLDDLLPRLGADSARATLLARRRNPYKGLEPFDESDSADFFGRDREVEDVCEALRDHRMVVVTGPSGVGKSSLAKAGVLPIIRSDPDRTWLITEMTPGSDPVATLVSGLARIATGSSPPAGSAGDGEPSVLLVVDQLEELYSSKTTDEQREAFADQIAELVSDDSGNVHVLATIRADFLDRPLADPRLGALIAPGLIPIAAPDTEQLSAAITGPADRVGLSFEPGVVAEIVADTQQGPGGLPVMGYTLHHLAGTTETDTITHDDYEKSGGVNAALLTNAESVMAGLNEAEVDVVRSIALRLFTLSADGSPMRRRALLSELRSLPYPRVSIDRVIEELTSHRLLTVDRDPVSRTATLEIAHESLFTHWPRLAGWIAEFRGDVEMQQRLSVLIDEWRGADESDAYLLAGSRLEAAESWAGGATMPLTEVESEYLEASRRVSDDDQRRSQRRRFAVMAALAIVGLVAIVFALEARDSQLRSRLLEAQNLEQEGIVLLEEDTELAALALAEAYALDQRPRTLAFMNQILTGGQLGNYRVGDEGARWVSFHPAEDLLAVGGSDGVVRLVDPMTGDVLASELVKHGARVRAMAFSSDGRMLASGGQDGSLALTDHAAGKTTVDRGAHDGGIVSMAFSPDGDSLVTVGVAGGLRIWSATDLTLLDEKVVTDVELGLEEDTDDIEPTNMRLQAVAYHPSGDRLAVATIVGRAERQTSLITYWDPDSLTLLPMTKRNPEAIWDVEYTVDGRFLVSGGRDEVPRVWDGETGELHQVLSGHDDVVQAVAVSPDGETVATGGADGMLFWEITEAGLVPARGPLGATAGQDALAFNFDGTLIAGANGNVRVFDAIPGGQVGRPVQTAHDLIDAIAIAPDFDQIFLSGGSDEEPGFITVLDSELATQRTIDIPTREIATLKLSSSGGQLALLERTGRLSTIEPATMTFLESTDTGLIEDIKKSLAFSPDETQIATVSEGLNTVLIWSAANLGSGAMSIELAVPPAHDLEATYGFTAVAFLDDERLVVSDVVGALRILDIGTGEEVGEALVAHDGTIEDLALSPDRSTIATAGSDRTIKVWEAGSLAPVATLTGHSESPLDVVFSPDGRFVASAARDQTVRVWHVASEGTIALLRGHDRTVRAVAFTPDQQYLLSGGVDGTLRKWDFRFDTWPDRLCEWMQLPVSDNDWTQVMGEEPNDPACMRDGLQS